MIMEIKNGHDISKLTMDQILEFMKSRPRPEIEAFQKFAQGTTERKGNGANFFDIRNWFVDIYFPDARTVKENKPTILDKIMSL